MLGFGGVTILLASALGIAAFVHFVYSSIVRYWNYFSDRNVVFERGIPLVGTLLGSRQGILGKKSIPELANDLYNKHSGRKFFGMYEVGGKPSYFVRDLDLIRDITIKDFDNFVNHNFKMDEKTDPLMGRALFSMSNQPWRDMRSTMSPLFTGSKMRFMLTLIIDCVQDFNSFIRNEIKSKSTTNSLEYDMGSIMMRLANDIIGSTAFGIQINTLKDPENEFYRLGKEMAYSIMGIKTLITIGLPKLASWLKIKIVSDQQDAFFRNVIKETLRERQKQKVVRNDMLHLLVLAKEGKVSDEQDKESDQDTGFATVSEFIASKSTQKLKNWTDEDLVAQCVLFFLAGYTGISSAFCFLCYELSLNPDIQERLYEEIMETKDQLNGKQLTFEALQKMKYMDMVVSEVLRKWPPAPQIDRAVNKQYLLEQNDGSKVLLEPNNVIYVSIFAIQRDPKNFPNPEVFDPERFSDENKKNIHPYSYLPFGSGPRNCIGNRFALLQMKAVTYQILQEFKIERSPKTAVNFKSKGGTNALEPEGGFFNQLTLTN